MRLGLWLASLLMTLILGAGAAAAPAGESATGPEALIQRAVELYGERNYEEALPVAKSALAAAEKTYGAFHPATGTCLNNLGRIYRAQGNAKDAEPQFKRALAIFIRTLGASHPMVATTLINLAEVYQTQGRMDEAEGLLKRAREIREQAVLNGILGTVDLAGTPAQAPETAKQNEGPAQTLGTARKAEGLAQTPGAGRKAEAQLQTQGTGRKAEAQLQTPEAARKTASPAQALGTGRKSPAQPASPGKAAPLAQMPGTAGQAAPPVRGKAPPRAFSIPAALPAPLMAFAAAFLAAIPLSLLLHAGFRRAILGRAAPRGSGRRLRLPRASWSSPLPRSGGAAANRSPLTLVRASTSQPIAGEAQRLSCLSHARRRMVALAYLLAGAAFAAAGAAAFFSLNEIRAVPQLVLLLAAAFLLPGAFMAGAVLLRSWPARGAFLLAYLAGVGAFGMWVAPRFDLLLALAAGAPPAAWLLSVHPRLRVTGPAVLFVLLAGAAAFVAADMGGHQYLVRARIIPPTPLVYYGALVFSTLAGLIAAVPLLWLLARASVAGWWSAELLLNILRALAVTAWFAALLLSVGPAKAVIAPVAFAAFTVTLILMLVLSARGRRPGAGLLLVQLLPPGRNGGRLLSDLAHYWRHIGPVQVAGTPDTVCEAMTPAGLMEFLTFRLRRRFAADAASLEASVEGARTDAGLDGLHGVSMVHCQGDIWQAAINRLIRRSEVVLVDLRGFGASRGAAYELQYLIGRLPANRMVLAIDSTTDAAELRDTLEHIWRMLPPDSPNRRGPAALAVVNTGAGGAGMRNLLRALCVAARPALAAPRRIAHRRAA